MRRRVPVVITAVLLALASCTVSCRGVSFLVARVVEVDCPRHVPCGQDFSVKVTFEYAGRVLADIGILEEETLRVVQSLTMISGFLGPGNATFVFNLTAPDAPGIWRLIATTRAWWANSWFSDPVLGQMAFAVEVVSEPMFWLNITSIHSFEVDGLRHDPRDSQEMAILLRRGRYTLFAEPVNSVSAGVRRVFDRWSDGVRSNPRTINLFHDTRLSAIYRTQFLLIVDSEHGEPIGGGWYDQHGTALFALLPEVKSQSLGFLEAKHVFDGWKGDWSGHAPIASIRMDSPKRVGALWREDISLPLWNVTRPLSIIMVLASLFLILRGLKKTGFMTGRKPSLRKLRNRAFALVVAVWLLVGATTTVTSRVNEGSTTTVRVGETRWTHWWNPESDTCILWLGGGIEGPPLIINPYWLESYNTMQFVQDLAKYYSVLTLETGSSAIHQTALKRTIRAEFYPSRLIHDAKQWATEAGYRYVYLVGYSVGGIAAVREATIIDREGWASPNGVVLITVPLDPFLPYANLLKANHLILYGTEMTKSYVDSGRIFFESTQPEGQYDDYWLHKEFKVVNSVAHEVWTIAKTGRYDSEATALTVDFIEQSKSLQVERRKAHLRDALRNLTGSVPVDPRIRVELTDVAHPHVVAPSMILRLSATIHWQKTAGARAWAILYSPEAGTVLSVRQLPDLESGSFRAVLLTRAPTKETLMRLNIVVLCGDDRTTTFPMGNFTSSLQIPVSSMVDLIIKTGVPRIQAKVNGVLHVADDIGVVRTHVPRGHNTIEVPLIAQLTSSRRVAFDGWGDGAYPSGRTVRLERSLQVEAYFRTQYYISASSEFGRVVGGGWHDQNASATITVSPPMIQDRTDSRMIIYKFAGWSPGDASGNMTLTVAIAGPLELQARWLRIVYGEEDVTMRALEFFASLSFLVLSIVLAKTRGREPASQT